MTTACGGHSDQPYSQPVTMLKDCQSTLLMMVWASKGSMLPHQIKRVEQQNNLTINVFGWDKGVIVHHISKQPEDMPRINLLLIEKAGKFHYTWIKDLNRLLRDQSKCSNRKHYCERCLHGYTLGGSARSPQARVSWDRPDSSTGGDAGRR